MICGSSTAALGWGALLQPQAIDGESCSGRGVAHEKSCDADFSATRAPSEFSFNCASEDEDDDEDVRSLPTNESLEETREWCYDVTPPTPQPGPRSRRSSAELRQEVPTLLDRMNEASSRVNCLEREADAAESRYRRTVTRYEEIYKVMRAEFGSAFDRCKPLFEEPHGFQALRAQLGDSTFGELARCYQTLKRHQDALANEHQLMGRLSQQVRDAKRVYTLTMSELEGISNRVHEMRQKC
jgi:hypothetical protein